MEILNDMPFYGQYLFDNIESNVAVKGLESFWDPSFSQVVVQQQTSSTYMPEALSCSGSPNNICLREMVAKFNGLHPKKPVCPSNIRALSCQPYIKKSSKRGWKPSTTNALKREVGCLLNESLMFVNASPVLVSHSPELKTSASQMYVGNNAIISPSSIDIINDQIPQECLSLQSYGNGELPHPCGESVFQVGDFAYPYAKSPVDSTSISLGSSEGSTSNEVLGSSEIQLMDPLFDQSIMMGYATHGSEIWLEDPFLNMTTIQSYTDDGCFIKNPNIEELAVDGIRETSAHVNDGLKAAHSPGFLGHAGCHQGNSSISLPLNESNEVLEHSRIDFEGSFVQSQTLAPESKILMQGSLPSSSCTQFFLPKPISGRSYANNTPHDLHVVNESYGIYTCALGNMPLNRYTDNRQLNDVQETSGVQSGCNYASENGIVSQTLKSVKSEDSTDTGDVGSSASMLSSLFDGRLRNDHMDIGLVHLLTASASAVARRDMHLASAILVRLKDMVSCSTNTMQRVICYFIQALERLVTGVKGVKKHAGNSSNSQGDILAAFQILHEIFPYIKFGHYTANQAILEAVQGAKRVHIVDFEILEGIQWPALMQALVSRKEGPPELHITALCRPHYDRGLVLAHKTCKRLSEFASAMCLPFSYSLVSINDGEVFHGSQIQAVQGEALVVNCMVHLPHMPQHTMATVASFLGMMQKFSPAIVTLVEEDLGCSIAAAPSYFSEALHHFYAIFDSLEACLPSQVEARMLVERVFMAPRIDSVINTWSQTMSSCAAYGVEVSDKYKWSTIMHSLSFKPVPLSFHNQAQAKLLLGLHRGSFELEERSHHLVLGWQTKPLYVASVWK